ncbi:MAG: 4-hydroxythreonine-4-phosphate dehydrogenase PdxA [Bacteroidales bacterium]|nr:4-hydroxythreonine-4-phosphate dehydrogenase PdxA [Bacteroidales bacterium]
MPRNNNDEHNTEKLIKVGITHGDVNGIGYEVIIKAFQDPRIIQMYTPIVYGASKVASYHRKTLSVGDFTFNLIKSPEQAHPRKPNIINCVNTEVKIELGKSTAIAGELSLLALEQAVNDLKKNKIDVLVTAPINKKNIQTSGFDFPGHTEYLARRFETEDYLMLMVSKQLRIGVVTGHIPINQVPEAINKDLILQKIKIMNHSLIRDFNIRKPRIAILGLNPHAGDEGLLGKEEQEIIKPAIDQANEENMLAFGPYPADGFFGSDTFGQFDGILAMYHDQGLIPFKTMSFDSGVNFTAGLPIVRTSPAHGTAYSIAGKNQASESSMREAVYLAVDIYSNRELHDEINRKPLNVSLEELQNNQNNHEAEEEQAGKADNKQDSSNNYQKHKPGNNTNG